MKKILIFLAIILFNVGFVSSFDFNFNDEDAFVSYAPIGNGNKGLEIYDITGDIHVSEWYELDQYNNQPYGAGNSLTNGVFYNNLNTNYEYQRRRVVHDLHKIYYEQIDDDFSTANHNIYVYGKDDLTLDNTFSVKGALFDVDDNYIYTAVNYDSNPDDFKIYVYDKSNGNIVVDPSQDLEFLGGGGCGPNLAWTRSNIYSRLTDLKVKDGVIYVVYDEKFAGYVASRLVGVSVDNYVNNYNTYCAFGNNQQIPTTVRIQIDGDGINNHRRIGANCNLLDKYTETSFTDDKLQRSNLIEINGDKIFVITRSYVNDYCGGILSSSYVGKPRVFNKNTGSEIADFFSLNDFDNANNNLDKRTYDIAIKDNYVYLIYYASIGAGLGYEPLLLKIGKFSFTSNSATFVNENVLAYGAKYGAGMYGLIEIPYAECSSGDAETSNCNTGDPNCPIGTRTRTCVDGEWGNYGACNIDVNACQEECQTLYESCEVEVCCAGLSCENGGPNLGDICIDCLDEGDACTNKLFCCGGTANGYSTNNAYCGSGHCCDVGEAWVPGLGCREQTECYTDPCGIRPQDNFVQWLANPSCFRNALGLVGEEQYTQSCCPADLYGGEGWYYTDIVVS